MEKNSLLLTFRSLSSVRKASEQSTDMRGVSPSATATAVFLTQSLSYVSRTRSSENQLHLMKVSERDRNVNKNDKPELATKALYIQAKKFYIDVKENRRGKFVRITEVTVNGQRTRIAMDITGAKEFHEHLTEFCEYYSSLGPAKWNRGPRMDQPDSKLRSETISRHDRRYYLDLRENHRGRFLRVTMLLPTHERTLIVIPAQGMIDVRDAMTDLLAEFGNEDTSVSKTDSDKSVSFDGKSIAFDIGENRRGPYVRISEISPNFRTAITVPHQSWAKFVELVEKAMEQKRSDGEAAKSSTTAESAQSSG